MTRPSLALLVVVALVASACAAHRSSTPSKSTSAAQAAEPKEEVVCFKERPTGSHIVQRVCYPKADYDTQVAAAQDQFRRMLQAASQGHGDAPPPQTKASPGK